jgi:nicotinamide riboside transporter PnuC
MTMLELIGTVATIVAVTGVVLNNRHRKECFYLFLVSNSLSLGLHVSVGLWSLAGRDALFAVLSVEGLLLWHKASRKKDRT